MDSTPESNLFRRVLATRLMRNAPLRHCLLVLLSYSLLFLVFFSPVILRGSLLAVGGDGLYIYLPNFYSHKVLWDPLLFSGFPMMADPQVLTWYPPALLFSLLPGAWNVFIIMAYVAGSSFMYGYVYALTRSRFAALTSGLVFGLSGFMIAHLGHAVIIHVAAWIPLILWSLEALRQRLTFRWSVIGSVAVALCFLAGHSQIFVYGLLVAGGYVLVLAWSAPVGRWRYFSASLLMVLVGIGLAAIQIVPTIELIGQSIRVGYPYHDFVAHALPPRQAFTLIFPMVFGHPSASGALPYFGPDNQTELTGYVGLLPLMLAAVGLVASKKKSLALFWLCVALLALVLATGDATPLARLLYHVPILNGFRAPARHFIELTVAVSVLSGLGVAAILQQQVSAKLVRRVIVSSSLAMLAGVVLLFMNAGYMNAVAAQKDIGRFSLLPWANSAVAVPLIVFLLAMAALSYWHNQPTSQFRRALLLSVLVIDLGSFGWFYEWRYVAPARNALNAPENVSRYKNLLQATNQRLISYRGYRGTTDEMPANLTRLWGVPNAAGYNVLMLSRINKLIPMIDQMEAPLPWSEPDDRSLDLMAVRYFFLPQNKIITDSGGVSWIKQDARFWLGSGCNEPPRRSATLNLSTPIKSTKLAMVSRLACSVQIPDGAEVVRLRLTDAQGKTENRSLLAGRDSSEWAYDCAGVTTIVRHRRANIFGNYASRMNDAPCEAHFYVTRLRLDGIKDIKSVEFEWVGGLGAIILDKLSLIDEANGTSYPIDSASMDSNRWRLVEETEGARVYENLRAMPRVWLATETANVNPNQALDAIKTGKLPDGRIFDPSRTALVEAPLTLNSATVDNKASATVAVLTNARMEVHTSSAAASFLITSDAYYPGWRATIDGREAQPYRVDYAIRGVVVPPGVHVVRFDYRPRSFYYGAVMSALSLFLLGALGLRAFSLKTAFDISRT
ncbi:MAG TPA: YfhO family protein [Pyrinomonadaceae bacterium]|nr:YfhO family protein [Pyrinomonadaceae bacterium]